MIVGGGFKAIFYSLRASREVGYRNMIRTSFSKNTCKTCAMGMGGQKGGMADEKGRFPEVCKKSFQAQLTDIQPPIASRVFAQNSIEDFRQLSGRLLERTGRLNSPLLKKEGDSHYIPISWEQALERISNQMLTTSPDRSFFYASGRSSNEAAFLLQLFARLYGTNNVNNCSYYCHQASGVGLNSTIGSGTATIQLEDLNHSDLIFVIGANPASNHPRFIRQLLKCRRRGGQVIVINPVKEPGLLRFAIPSDLRSLLTGGSKIATQYLQIPIGGDIALFKGIAKAVLDMGTQDDHFMASFTQGAEEYVNDIRLTEWAQIVAESGISKNKIEEIARIYGKSQATVFSWAMGITHHLHGVENVESIVNLALLRGMIGKPFAGLLPLRGHSNIQGIGSVGFTPILKGRIAEKLEHRLGIRLPDTTGMDTLACLEAAKNGAIDLAFLLGGNLFNASPDAQYTEAALDAIPFKVFLNTSLNQGHFHGVSKEVLILPVAARDEEMQKTTQESMFNFVRLSDGGLPRLDNVRSEVEIIGEIAERVIGNSILGFEYFKSHKHIREFIAEVVPGYGQLKNIDEKGEEFQIENRTFHEPVFATADQKAHFKVCAIPDFSNPDGSYRMMSIRSEGQFNSIIYEEEDLYREQSDRWIVLMNQADIRREGLKVNDRVNLISTVGKMENMRVRPFDIPSGNIMTYYPESNILIPHSSDPRSFTPSYKLTWVNLEKPELQNLIS